MVEQMNVVFRGSVQGVSFRYITVRTAAGFEVTGYVTNLPDGTVRLVAEGESAELAEFLTAVEDRMSGYITGRTVKHHPASGAFHTFGVR